MSVISTMNVYISDGRLQSLVELDVTPKIYTTLYIMYVCNYYNECLHLRRTFTVPSRSCCYS